MDPPSLAEDFAKKKTSRKGQFKESLQYLQRLLDLSRFCCRFEVEWSAAITFCSKGIGDKLINRIVGVYMPIARKSLFIGGGCQIHFF